MNVQEFSSSILCFQEGRAYLEKNLTEWKKPLLVGTTVGDCQTDSSAKESAKGGKKSTKKTAFQVCLERIYVNIVG